MEYEWIKISFTEYKKLELKGAYVRKEVKLPEGMTGITNHMNYLYSFDHSKASFSDYNYYKRGKPYLLCGAKGYEIMKNFFKKELDKYKK